MSEAYKGRKEVSKYRCPKCGYLEETNQKMQIKHCPYCIPREAMLCYFYEIRTKE